MKQKIIVREYAHELGRKIGDLRNTFIQVLVGPKGAGKTTLVRQAVELSDSVLCLADSYDSNVPGTRWLIDWWQIARKTHIESGKTVVLVFEHLQDRNIWASTILRLWDADRRNSVPIKVVLVADNIQALSNGLENELVGCYEVLHCPYWSFSECQEAFGYSLDDYLYFGGIPGACALSDNVDSWRAYICEHIVQPAVGGESVDSSDIRKRTLLSDLFDFCMMIAGQEMSYNKMLGYLQNAGNTITLKRYLDYFSELGLVMGMEKYRETPTSSGRSSSPKVIPLDTGIVNAVLNRPRTALDNDRQAKALLLECAIGAHLHRMAQFGNGEVYYWRDGNFAVDFVMRADDSLIAIDVHSGRIKQKPGTLRFSSKHPNARFITVGGDSPLSLSPSDFLSFRVIGN